MDVVADTRGGFKGPRVEKKTKPEGEKFPRKKTTPRVIIRLFTGAVEARGQAMV